MKSPNAAKKEGGGQVVPIKAAGLPVDNDLLDIMSAQSGKGVSTDQADNQIPLVYVLQAQSPQVLNRNPQQIEGAAGGDIWLRNAPNPIVKGEEGMEVIPVHFSKDVVEWRQRDSGGGFVARHDFQAGEDIVKIAARLGATATPDPKSPMRIMYLMPNGNELIETRYHTVYVIRDDDQLVPFVIPLSSTGHTFSRRWMFKMNNHQLPGGRGPSASFNYVYRIKTVPMSNASGEWYAYQEDDGVIITTRLGTQIEDPAERKAYLIGVLEQCNNLHDAFASGVKQAEVPEEAAATGADTTQAEQHI